MACSGRMAKALEQSRTRTAKNIGLPKMFLKKTFWEISPASGVYKSVLDRAGFFDPGAICGLLFVYAVRVPIYATRSTKSCGGFGRRGASL